MFKLRRAVHLNRKTMKDSDKIKLDYMVKKVGGRKRNIPKSKG